LLSGAGVRGVGVQRDRKLYKRNRSRHLKHRPWNLLGSHRRAKPSGRS
jgi:hypothetical protein